MMASTDLVDRPDRQCGRKLGYSSKADAKRAARRLRSLPTFEGGQLDAYRCPHCARWHVGGARRPPP